MNSSKKWIIGFIATVLTIVILFGISTYIFDPLLQYGSEKQSISWYEYTEMYSNPGIAKNYDYDTIMVGTSIIENTSMEECNKDFNCKSVLLPYSGGTAHNMNTILNYSFLHNDKIKRVIWELDEYQLMADYDVYRYPLPEYLYDDNKINDINYLLNADVCLHYTVKNLMNTLKGEHKNALVNVEDNQIYGKQSVINSITKSEKKKSLGKDIYSQKVQDTLNHNFIPLIEENKNIEFNLFIPPFSVAYWYSAINEGLFDGQMQALIDAVEKLVTYDNVNIYYYQGEQDIITDLSNYRDYSHYNDKIKSQMIDNVSKGKNKLTKENYLQTINKTIKFLEDYNYEQIFN